MKQVLALALIAAGCSGSIVHEDDTGGRTADDDDQRTPSTGDGADPEQNDVGGSGRTPLPPDPGIGACVEPDQPAGTLRAWRLTATQYANTVATLFTGRSMSGITGLKNPVAVGLPFREVDTTSRFSTNASSFSMTDSEFENVLASADAVAAALRTALLADKDACTGNASAGADCLARTVRDKATLLFRRPVSDAEVARYAGVAKDKPFAEALQASLVAMLVSPKFLFRNEVGSGPDKVRYLDAFQIAENIAYSLIDSPPDEPLWSDAASGALADRDVARAHVRRLLSDPGSNQRLLGFLREYAGHEQARGVAKPDVKKDFAAFNIGELVKDTDSFLAHVASEGADDGFIAALFGASRVAANDKTVATYGLVADGKDRKIYESEGRFGLLTQPAILVMGSQDRRNDPIKRGHFIQEEVFCGSIPAIPIEDIPPFDDDPNKTLREKLAIHSANPSCNACHRLMDGLGLGLEGFDHYGRARDAELGRPVDVSGDIVGSLDQDGPFTGARELSAAVVKSSATSTCMVKKTLHYFAGRTPNDADDCSVEDARKRFVDGGGGLVDLVAEVLTSEAVLLRRAQ